MNKKIRETEIEHLIALRKRGLSNREIGNMYGVDAKCITTTFCAYKRKSKKAGIKVDIGRSPMPPKIKKEAGGYIKTMQKVARLMTDGYSIAKAAKQAGCAIDYVYCYLPSYLDKLMRGEVTDDLVKEYFVRQQLKGIDYGKLGALKRAGWSDENIADDLGVAVCVVQMAHEKDNGVKERF